MFTLHQLLMIIAAAMAAFILGAFWYSPVLFANAWVKAQGHSPEKLAAMQAGAGRAYGISFICFLVMATVMEHIFIYFNIHGLHHGAFSGAVAWLGFGGTMGLIANVYSEKPIAAFLIDTGYQLVYLILMGAILGTWG